jgi:hypothetical protein
MELHTYFFLLILIDFYSKNNNVSQVYTYVPKIHFFFKHYYRLCSSISPMYICAIPHVIIYRVRHLFQKLLLFFLCEVILVIHCCFQNKNLYQNY